MKKIKFTSILLLSVLMIIYSCKSDKCPNGDTTNSSKNPAAITWQEITNEYFIWNIPTHFESVDYLSKDPGAYMQIHDKKNDIFAFVIQDSVSKIEKLLQSVPKYDKKLSQYENYARFVYDMNAKKTIDYKLLKKEDRQLESGAKAKIEEYYATIKHKETKKNVKVYFNNAIIDGGANFFQIIMWTTKDKKEKNEQIMNKIQESFTINKITP